MVAPDLELCLDGDRSNLRNGTLQEGVPVCKDSRWAASGRPDVGAVAGKCE